MKTENEDIIFKYATESTSKQSSKIDKIILNETSTTRRTLLTTIVKNYDDPEASLHIAIINERKSKNGFESENPPDLRKLKAGECHSCTLDSSDALALYKELSRQYALADQIGIAYGNNQYNVIKTTGSASLSNDDENALIPLLKRCRQDPDFIENANLYQLLEKQKKGIERFKEMFLKQCQEREWQNFLEEHDWILGGTNDILYLSTVSNQPILSGANVQGKGERRGDFLMCTQGNACFTSICEIKKANTDLLNPSPYRQTYRPSDELNGGGIAQLRDYLRGWLVEGSRTEYNRGILEDKGIYTVQPLGILIIGNLDEVKDHHEKRKAFELFRNNQKDIRIITFDEVFARAEHLLKAFTSKKK